MKNKLMKNNFLFPTLMQTNQIMPVKIKKHKLFVFIRIRFICTDKTISMYI